MSTGARKGPITYCCVRSFSSLNLSCYIFSFVEDTRFNTECESIVQHVCEEHYKVAVPKPVVFPVPIFTNSGPAPGPYPAPRPYPAPYTVLPGPGPAVRTKRQLSLSDPGLVSRRVKAATQLPPAPLLSHQELPAPPGCRSVATQKCHKVIPNI